MIQNVGTKYKRHILSTTNAGSFAEIMGHFEQVQRVGTEEYDSPDGCVMTSVMRYIGQKNMLCVEPLRWLALLARDTDASIDRDLFMYESVRQVNKVVCFVFYVRYYVIYCSVY